MCAEKLPSSQKAVPHPHWSFCGLISLLIIIYCLPQFYMYCYAIEIILYIQFAICFFSFNIIVNKPSRWESLVKSSHFIVGSDNRQKQQQQPAL